MNEKEPKIVVSTDGPYLVSGNIPLQKQTIETDEEGISSKWSEPENYPSRERYSLCRCGHSKNKPFCDGSHNHASFKESGVAENKPFLENAERMEGPELILVDNYDLCASARFCDRAGTVWELIRKDDEESKKIAIQECADCPSGRLVAFDKKSQHEIEPEFTPCISVTEDPAAGVSGPLWVKGGVEIESAEGNPYEKRNRVTLCRCGHSKNMPFCDSSHIETKFDDGSIGLT